MADRAAVGRTMAIFLGQTTTSDTRATSVGPGLDDSPVLGVGHQVGDGISAGTYTTISGSQTKRFEPTPWVNRILGPCECADVQNATPTTDEGKTVVHGDPCEGSGTIEVVRQWEYDEEYCVFEWRCKHKAGYCGYSNVTDYSDYGYRNRTCETNKGYVHPDEYYPDKVCTEQKNAYGETECACWYPCEKKTGGIEWVEDPSRPPPCEDKQAQWYSQHATIAVEACDTWRLGNSMGTGGGAGTGGDAGAGADGDGDFQPPCDPLLSHLMNQLYCIYEYPEILELKLEYASMELGLFCDFECTPVDYIAVAEPCKGDPSCEGGLCYCPGDCHRVFDNGLPVA